MFCKWQRHTLHQPPFKQMINHKGMLECKKRCISNHDSRAVGLTFVLFGKSPELKTPVGWSEAGWQSGWLSQGFASSFLGDLFRHSPLDSKAFRDQQLKNTGLWNISLFQYATNFCPHLKKESMRHFILHLIKDFSTTEQQHAEQI